MPPLTGVAVLLASSPAAAHPLHATTSTSTAHVAPAVVALGVAGGLLVAPRLTGLAAGLRSGLLLRGLLALGAATAALLGGVDGPVLVVLLGLCVLLLAPAAGLATGLLLLLVPGLLEDPGVVPAAHLLGAGVWSGTVLHVLLGLGRRPDADALRSAGPVAAGSALLAVGSGVAA
ncbi:MAG: hypothetical protein JWM64_620, partial [Frankiales bacterium]|nr:hypothetical protein [Frankiales bacterium]